MSKTKRKNYHENFEEVYLRSSTVKRFLPKADQSIVHEEAFKKIVRHLSDSFYRKHSGLLLRHGFDLQDIRSIVTLWCLTFTGVEPRAPESRDKDYYYIMMHFVNQRLSRFCDWVIKKFSVGDVVNEKVHLSEPGNEQFQFDYIVFHSSAESPENPEDALIEGIDDDILTQAHGRDSYSSQLVKAQDALEAVKTRMSSRRRSRVTEAKLQERAEALRERIDELQTKRKRQTQSFKDMKAELIGNLEKYKESLAHYATSRHTPSDARKKAREFCKEYGINYVEWAQKKISETGRDASEFVL